MSPQETGRFIAKLRKEAGITQQELAEKLNVTAKAVSRWETGKGYPDVTILPELSSVFEVSVNELLNGEYCPKEVVEVAEKTILTICYQAKINKQRNIRLLITISLIATVVFLLLCVTILFGILKSFKGEPYAILSNDLSNLNYYGEIYVPLQMQGYLFKIGEEIVDEVVLEDGTFFDKLFSEYALHSIKGVQNNELIYLRSEHEIDFYVKESKLKEYQSQVANFEPEIAYSIFEQSNGYEKELLLDKDLFFYLLSLNNTNAESSLTCNFEPNQPRMTVIAYDSKGTIYKEYGDIFVVNNHYYWYDYSELDFPDSVAYSQKPYKISDKYNEILISLFQYY